MYRVGAHEGRLLSWLCAADNTRMNEVTKRCCYLYRDSGVGFGFLRVKHQVLTCFCLLEGLNLALCGGDNFKMMSISLCKKRLVCWRERLWLVAHSTLHFLNAWIRSDTGCVEVVWVSMELHRNIATYLCVNTLKPCTSA